MRQPDCPCWLPGDGAQCAECGQVHDIPPRLRLGAIAELARDLLEMHYQEAISLDTWVAAREVVEAYCGPIEENGI